MAPVSHGSTKLATGRHIVFSVPIRLRGFFRRNRKLLRILDKAAWRSVKDVLQADAKESLKGEKSSVDSKRWRPGAVLVGQSSGDLLEPNSHLHGLVSNGLFDSAGGFHDCGKWDLDWLTRLFAKRVLKRLKQLNLISPDDVQQILSQEHILLRPPCRRCYGGRAGFSAWVGEPVAAQDQASRLFLARYIDRAPLAKSRLSEVGGHIRYQGKNGKTKDFSALDLIAYLTVNIPNAYETLQNYYGEYSYRARGERARQKRQLEAMAQSSLTPGLASSVRPASNIDSNIDGAQTLNSHQAKWAALFHKIFEIDPLLCPKCGGTMEITAFIQDPRQIKRLLKHLRVAGFTKPVPIKATDTPGPRYVPDQDAA